MVLAGTGPVTDDGPDPVDERDGSGPSGVRPRASALTPFLGAVTVGLLAAATFREGAFHPADAMAVGVVSVALIVACLGSGIDRRAWLAVAGLLALTTWWIVDGFHHHANGHLLPLGASVPGFAAAFLVMRRQETEARRQFVTAITALGAAFGLAGLVAVGVRWFPLAISSDGLWRESTTITYSNSAGTLLAICLLLSFGTDLTRRFPRLCTALLAASLVATESRGATLAFIVALPLVPWSTLRRAIRPTALGVGAGLSLVATAFGDQRQLGSLLLAGALLAVATVVPPRTSPLVTLTRSATGRWKIIGLLLATAGVAVVACLALRVPFYIRQDPGPGLAREAEARAALGQWQTSPFVGVGPDKILLLVGPHGCGPGCPNVNFDYFAHDEYLQILADSGLIGALLLAESALGVAVTVRRIDVATSCATAGLVTFAVAATLDYDWHLPALALLGGCAAGLAGVPAGRRRVPPDGIDTDPHS